MWKFWWSAGIPEELLSVPDRRYPNLLVTRKSANHAVLYLQPVTDQLLSNLLYVKVSANWESDARSFTDAEDNEFVEQLVRTFGDRIQKLELENCEFDVVLIELLEMSSLRLGFLRVLNLGDNQISQWHVEQICRIISNGGWSSLEELDLSQNRIQDSSAFLIAASVKRNTTLQNLNLYFNLIHDEGSIALFRLLGSNCHSL